MAHRDQESPLALLWLALFALLAWAAWEALPVSLICLAAGLLYAMLRPEAPERRLRSRRTVRGAIRYGVQKDSSRMAGWFFVATAIVWGVQILLNLFRGHVQPGALAGAELAIYDAADAFRGLLSFGTALSCLVLALLLSWLLHARWPVATLGRLRQVAAAGVALFGALSTFTFVTTEVAEGRIRAAIVADLHAAAQARRNHAALQWMAADLKREDEEPQIRADDLRPALALCRDETWIANAECDPELLGYELHKLLDPELPGYAPTEDRVWLPDFATVLAPPPDSPPGAMDEPKPLALAAREHDLGELFRLRLKAKDARREAESASELTREALVEGIAGLVGHDYAGVVGDFVDTLRARVADVLAAELLGRVRRGLASGSIGLPPLFERHQAVADPFSEQGMGLQTESVAAREPIPAVVRGVGEPVAPPLGGPQAFVFTPPARFQPMPMIVPVYQSMPGSTARPPPVRPR